MVDIQTRKAYSEILEVLKYIPKEYLSKTPKQILEVFGREKLENYTVKINKQKPIDKNSLQKETLAIIAMLNLQYWCTNEELKKKLYDQYSKNEEKYQQELCKKYDVNNIFEKRKTMNSPPTTQNDNTKNLSLIEQKPSFFKTIINKIKNLFHSNETKKN